MVHVSWRFGSFASVGVAEGHADQCEEICNQIGLESEVKWSVTGVGIGAHVHVM